MKQSSRRTFIKDSAKTTVILGVGAMVGGSIIEGCGSSKKAAAAVPSKIKTPFDQQPLPYSYAALEPYIDAMTMEIHYTKHAAGYTKNLKDAAQAEGVTDTSSVENVLANISKYSTKMRNNAGGHYNHELFWKSMKTNGGGTPSGALLTAIETKFKSFADFKTAFNDAAKGRFGSGWAWVIVNNNKDLEITSTPNQDNTLMDISEKKGIPLLGLDVWEHAYYLKYQNKRPDYIENWWNVVNWQFVQDRYQTIVG